MLIFACDMAKKYSHNYLLTGVELEREFGVSHRTVKRWIKSGIEFPVVIIGKSKRYPYGLVKEFFEWRTYANYSKTKKWRNSNTAKSIKETLIREKESSLISPDKEQSQDQVA